MERRLSSTPATELDNFIEDHLLPNTTFRTEVRTAIDTISAFLKENCFQDAKHQVRVTKVVKGGSSGKDTELRGRSDAELVVFVNNLTSFEDQLKRWGEFIEEIKKQLRKLQREKRVELKFEIKGEQWPNSLALNFKLSSPELQQEVEFDVLLAYDVLGDVNTDGRPNPEIYKSLIQKCTSLGLEGEFSTCFAELQRNFLRDRPPKLKNLIRLVKHWYQLCKEKLRKPLPPQYALELLTVYAWEQASGDTEFNTAQGFRTVLELVTKHRELQIYWTTYYDFEHQDISKYLHRQLRRASLEFLCHPNSVLLWFLSMWLRKHPQDFCDCPDVVTVKRLVDYIRLSVTSTEVATQTEELLSMLEKQESKTDCVIIRPTTPEASKIQEMLPLRPASVAGPQGDLKPLESPAVWEPIVPVAGTEQLLNFDQCLPTSSDTLGVAALISSCWCAIR